MDIETYAKLHPKTGHAIILPVTLKRISTLPKGSIILDIGCAEGETIFWLESQFPKKYKYIGIDLSETRIKCANKKKNTNSRFFVSSATNLSQIRSSSIDFALCSQVIEHVDHDELLVSELSRILRKGGRFQLDTVFKKWWAKYFYNSPSGWALDPTHVREYQNLTELRKMFERNLSVTDVILKQVFRNLRLIHPSFPKINLKILGYYTVFILGKKL